MTGEHQLEGLGRGNQQVRWALHLPLALRLRGVPVPQADPKSNGFCEVDEAAVDVPVQRTQRRDVEDGQGVPILVKAAVQQRKHGRHGFARASGCHDHALIATGKGGQRKVLNRRWAPTAAINRRLEGGMERVEDRRHARASFHPAAREP